VELTDKIIVVTGAAGGIGAACALSFAEAGARRVVCADLDEARAVDVAEHVNEQVGRYVAIGRFCDVGREASVVELIDEVTTTLGTIDIYFANAGVAELSDPLSGDDVWDRAWRVNTMAHVWAARALLPVWLNRGEGYLVTTSSVGGILAALGDAAYSVTKHASVGFAEWMAITYRDEGIRVSCVCPGGVDTAILAVFMGGRDQTVALAAGGGLMDPARLAAIVVQGIRDETMLILTHPETKKFVERRVDDHERWISGMVRHWRELRPTMRGSAP